MLPPPSKEGWGADTYGFLVPWRGNRMEPGGLSPRKTAITCVFRPEGAADQYWRPFRTQPGNARIPGVETPGFILSQLRREKPIPVRGWGGSKMGCYFLHFLKRRIL